MQIMWPSFRRFCYMCKLSQNILGYVCAKKLSNKIGVHSFFSFCFSSLRPYIEEPDTKCGVHGKLYKGSVGYLIPAFFSFLVFSAKMHLQNYRFCSKWQLRFLRHESRYVLLFYHNKCRQKRLRVFAKIIAFFNIQFFNHVLRLNSFKGLGPEKTQFVTHSTQHCIFFLEATLDMPLLIHCVIAVVQ